jgi:hypothetical protein
MTTHTAKRLLLTIALAASAAGAQAGGLSYKSADPYTDGARSVHAMPDPYTEGARSVQEPRNPFADGARTVDPYYDGARTLAGLDRTGVSADPARKADPYLDGANA